MDVVLFTLISNPLLQSPLISTGESLTTFVSSLKSDSTLVTAPAKPRVNKRAREDPIQTDKSTLDRIVDPRRPTFLEFSAKRRRSDRLKVLTTKVYLIRDRKDLDRVETLYAEDIPIPNNHVQATKSSFQIHWAKAEKDEVGGLKRKDAFETVDEINVPPGTKIIPGK